MFNRKCVLHRIGRTERNWSNLYVLWQRQVINIINGPTKRQNRLQGQIASERRQSHVLCGSAWWYWVSASKTILNCWWPALERIIVGIEACCASKTPRKSTKTTKSDFPCCQCTGTPNKCDSKIGAGHSWKSPANAAYSLDLSPTA